MKQARFLDPRPCACQALRDAVHIPVGELKDRTFELPSRERVIRVIGPEPIACEAIKVLQELGRTAEYCGGGRAAQSDEPLRLWEPNEMLVDLAVAPARALDLACGSGRDAVFLASNGWQVTAIDILPDAIKQGRALESRYLSPGDHPIEWRQHDLERSVPAIEPYRLVTMFRFLHRPLLAQVMATYKGHFLMETFTKRHLERNTHPKRAERLLEEGELLNFARGTVHHFSEGWRGNSHTARLWVEASHA